MIDTTMRAQLLAAPLIIKNFVDGDNNCNYENYLLELINTSKFFRDKSSCGFKRPISESNSECDAISENYQLDFKLLASKTSLQARSILSYQISKITQGITVSGGSKCPGGSVQATRIFAALRGKSLEELMSIRDQYTKNKE